MSLNSDANAIMQYSFLHVFAHHHSIDAHELEFIEKLALRSGSVTDHEKAILAKVFGHVTEQDVEPDVWVEMQHFRRKYNF